MSFALSQRCILVSATTLGLLALLPALSGCGQKGALYLPHTPAAAQRATLPQTVFGGAHTPRTAASAAAPASPPAPVLPNVPDTP